MNSLEGSPSQKQTQETIPRPQDQVVSFQTAQGSVYTYSENGQTARFKTATGEQMQPQDITVFATLTPEQEQDILLAYRSKHPTQKTKVYVVERQPDDSPKIIRRVDQVVKPDALYLAIFRDGAMAENVPASLYPQIGANVFDTRHFQQGDVWMTERHLGNKVTDITYKT